MTPAPKSELSRDLSLFQITMMGVGMMIGAGVFVATGIGIGIAGPGGVLLALALNGLLAFLSVMTYAELGSAIPRAGGGYSYVQECFGGFTGFLTGWISWFGHAVAGSLYSITFATYLLHFLAGFESFSWLTAHMQLYERILAVTIALVFIYINYRGASETGTIGSVIAIGQTVVLALIGVIGVIIAARSPERLNNFQDFLPRGWNKVLVVMGFSLIGFEGYEVIANTAEEVVDAKENVPKGIFYAVIIVITTYLFIAFAAIIGGGASGVDLITWFSSRGATGFADAIGQLFPFAGLFVIAAAVFASTSALNATLYSSTRVSFALGRDGFLPKVFARISKKTRIPNVALLASGAITVVVAAVFDVEIVCAGASIFFIVLFNLVTLAVIKIRKEQGDTLDYGYLMPYFPLVPILSFIGQTTIGIYLFDMGYVAYLISGGWIFLGIGIYVLYSRGKFNKDGDPAFRAEGIAEGAERNILVAMANSATASVLTSYALRISDNEGQDIIASNIVAVPPHIPLEEARPFAGDVLSSTVQSNIRTNPIEHVVRYARDVSQGIITLIKERKVETAVLGWRGYTGKKYFGMGSTLDPVIERAPCDLLIVKPGENEPVEAIREIVLPLRGKGPHARLAARIVTKIASAQKAHVTVIHGQKDAGSSTDEFRATVSKLLPDIEYSVKSVSSAGLVESIVAEAAAGDLLVLGASADPLLRQLLFGTIPLRVAARCDKTVLMVKSNRGFRPWLSRWLSN